MKRWGFGRRHNRPMERAVRIVGYFDAPQWSPKLFVSHSFHVGHAKSLLARRGRRSNSDVIFRPRKTNGGAKPAFAPSSIRVWLLDH